MKPILLFVFFCVLPITTQAHILAEHSGAWYNPEQAGHGLSIQVLSEQRSLAFWFTYTQEGQPMFLVVDGKHGGHTLTGPAYIYQGMIWRQFDPNTLSGEVWGEISIEFLGCNRAFLTWSSLMSGYGDGQLELSRLTFVRGHHCTKVPTQSTGDWKVQFLDAGQDEQPFSVTVEPNGTFEFYDGLACLWEGHFHAMSADGRVLRAQYGAPSCSWVVPIQDAHGSYYPNGVSICNSGGDCISFDEAMSFESLANDGSISGLFFYR